MEEDNEKLHQDLEERIARYGTTHPIAVDAMDAVGNGGLDTLQILSDLEQYCKTNAKEMYMCRRKYPCTCKVKDKCRCDDDEYSNITNVKMEVLSNCLFSIVLSVHIIGGQVDKKREALRIFRLANDREEREEPLFDLVLPTNIVELYYPQHVTFQLSDAPTMRLGSVIFNFHYLEYNN